MLRLGGNDLSTASAAANRAAFAPGITRFVRSPFMSRALFVGGATTLAGNLTLLGPIHRRKSAIFLGHLVLPSRPTGLD